MKKFLLKSVAAAAVIIFGFGCVFLQASCAEADIIYYVDSVRGSDTNSRYDGTSVYRPFYSIGKACEKVKSYMQSAGSAVKAEIYIKAGTYNLADTIMLNEEYHLFEGSSLTFKTYGEGEVVVSGGKKITGWTLYDSEKNIYSASAQGYNPRQLYVNGQRAVRARTADDYLVSSLTVTDDQTGYICSTAEPASWSNPSAIEFVYVSEWCNHRCNVTEVSLIGSSSVIKMNSGFSGLLNINYGTAIDKPWYMENAYEFLDEEREFYVNTAENKIYYKPASNENLSSAEIYIPVLTELIHIEGMSSANRASNISFENISFMYSAWDTPSTLGSYTEIQNNVAYSGKASSAIKVKQSENISFNGCTFTHLGGDGLQFIKGIENCRLENCEISDASAGAVTFGGTDESDILGSVAEEKVQNGLIKNCKIYNTGIDYRGASAITVGFVNGMNIIHNEIYNTSYSGIHIGWGWDNYADRTTALKDIKVRYNYIHDIMISRISDGGAVYTNGRNEGGCETAYNYIKSQYQLSSCLYNDEGTNDWITHHNVVDNRGIEWNGKTPRWMHWWINTIRRCKMYDNYVDSERIQNNGTDCTIENTTVTAGDWNVEALRIMANAGVEKAESDDREFFGDENYDGSELMENGSFDYENAVSIMQGWNINSVNTYEFENTVTNRGSSGSLKVFVNADGKLLEKSVSLRRNLWYHLSGYARLESSGAENIYLTPYIEYENGGTVQSIEFSVKRIGTGKWYRFEAYFQPPAENERIDYSVSSDDSLYNQFSCGIKAERENSREQVVLYVDDLRLNEYNAVYNPNFKNDFEGWKSVSGVTRELVDFDPVSEGVSELIALGEFPNVSKVAKFTAAESGARAAVIQNFAFEKNTVYDVSYWVKGGDTNGKISTISFPLGTNPEYSSVWPYAIWAKTNVTDSGWTHVQYQINFGDSSKVKAFDGYFDIRYQNSSASGETASMNSEFYMAELNVKKSVNAVGNPYFLSGSAATRSCDDEAAFGQLNTAYGGFWSEQNTGFEALNNCESNCYDGAKACGQFTVTSENKAVKQNITVSESGKHIISVWVKADGDSALTVDGEVIETLSTEYNGWKKLTGNYNFSADKNYSVGIRFDELNGLNGCLFKDFSVTKSKNEPYVENLCVLSDSSNGLIADYKGICSGFSDSSVKVRGAIGNLRNAVIIAAGYTESGKLCFYSSYPIEGELNDEELLIFEESIALTCEENISYLKLFIWESQQSMKPIDGVLNIK